jgi:hypothetical protein
MCGVAVRDVTSERVNYMYRLPKKSGMYKHGNFVVSCLKTSELRLSVTIIHGSDLLFLEKGCNRYFPEGLML